jgi:arabinofuranan 3-O-arabinosyltransferase
VSVACGFGPALVVNGKSTALQLDRVAAVDVLAGNAVHARICGSDSLSLPAGADRIQLTSLDWVHPVSLRFTRAGGYLADQPDPSLSAHVQTWSATSRQVRVATSDRPGVLVVRENANAGWRATLHGKELSSVMIDGWQQGYLVPAGSSGVVELRFTPQRSVAIGLIVGAVAALGLLVLAFVPARRRIAATRPARLDTRGADVGWTIATTLVAGLAGLVGGVAVAGLRGRLRVPSWAAPGVLLVAGALEAIAPFGSAHPLADSIGVQVLVLIAILLALLRSGGPGEPS